MKTILTMPSPELALLTMTGEGKPFVLNRRTMAELEALLDEVRRRAPRALVLTGRGGSSAPGRIYGRWRPWMAGSCMTGRCWAAA